jgi:putative ABC transport system substrate-binding protein
MRLRTIGLISSLALGLLAGPLPTVAQQKGKVPRIGYLAPRSAVPKEFKQGLRELGYIEGKNIIFEPRFAEGKFDRFPRFAAELVRLKVDVIVTWSSPAARAAKKATTTIPIVMLARGDPVRRGLVASLARPGGNITGMTGTTGTGRLPAKHLELLKEVVPNLSLVGALWDSRRRNFPRTQKRVEHTAGLLGLKIQSLEVQSPDDLEGAFQVATKAGAQGLITFRHAPILRGRKRIVALAIKSRLPAIYGDKIFVKAGGLMSYGPDQANLYRRQATYVDKILKGANPANLPVEQPKKFELLINLKTAKQIGITIPPEFLFRADKVIK